MTVLRFISFLSTLLSLLGAETAAHPASLEARSGSIDSRGLTIPYAERSIPLVARAPRRKAKRDAFMNLRRRGPGGGDTITVDGAGFDHEYLTNVTVGGQNFLLWTDTGSSDTWVVQQGFDCVNANGTSVNASTCAFGTDGFNVSVSSTFEPLPNASFIIEYGSGEVVSGPFGLDTVSVGGVSVTQQVAFPDRAFWEGDGFSSGLIGLAFPAETSMFNVSDPRNATADNHVLYDPFFVTAVKQKKVNHPFFSLALNRPTVSQQRNDPFDPNLGFLSLGGIAPVPFIPDSSVTVPVQAHNATTGEPLNGPDAVFFWYTVQIDAYTFPGSANLNVTTANNNTILDSGTALNIIPSEIVAAYAAAFDPPAVIDPAVGYYVVQCNATAPEFVVTIGGKNFSMDARDQIIAVPPTLGFGNDTCVTGTQPHAGQDVPSDFFLLGDQFLYNVVATFNPIAAEVTLAQRAPY